MIKDFPGNYSEYRAWAEFQERESAEQNKRSAATTGNRQSWHNRDTKKRLSYKEQKELEQLTDELERLNGEKDELDRLFASGQVIDDMMAKSTRYTQLKDLLDQKELRWLELSEKTQ